MTAAPPIRRRTAIKAACRAAGLPLYAADLATVRGRCLGRRCRSRWGVVRVSLDFTDPDTVQRYATVECAVCGRTWRRCRVPALRSEAGYQSVRLELILPSSTLNRWRSRGRWHREGTDHTVLRDADMGDLDEAARAHRERAERRADAKARAKAKKEAESLREHAEAQAWIARMAEREAERAREEAEAAARESGR